MTSPSEQDPHTNPGPDGGEQTVRLPVAHLRPIRVRSWAWILPLLALALAAFLGRAAWRARGPELRLFASDGHGIAVGDPLLHRGIAVGKVLGVELVPALERVEIRLRLEPAAERLARAGSRFWVERPSIALDRLRGVETLLGGRHLSVLPGPPRGRVQHEFVCLETPPILTRRGQGGLEFVLEAPRTFGLAPGAPITYRQIHVGSVIGVGLSSDATVVEVRCVMQPGYARLVREDTRFWEAGGLEAGFELMQGFTLELESLRSLLVGGIALATPTRPGPPARTGRRFVLHAEPEEEWLEWSPALALGGAQLPPGTPTPILQRTRLVWEEGFFGRSRSRSGWTLATDAGLIGPDDVLVPPQEAEEPALELRGQRLELLEEPLAVGPRVARRAFDAEALDLWPSARVRPLAEPEDCVVVGDPSDAPTAIGAARLRAEEGGWVVDPAIAFDETWHGAVVLARKDGRLLGLLTVEEGRGRVAPVDLLFETDSGDSTGE